MTAQCACGQASITLAGQPRFVGACHCDNCKRRTGSAFGVSAYFDRSDVVRTAGETRVYAFHHTEANHDQARHFCSECGTTLYWYLSSEPTRIGVAGGCFAAEALPEPAGSYAHGNREPWVSLPDHWQHVG